MTRAAALALLTALAACAGDKDAGDSGTPADADTDTDTDTDADTDADTDTDTDADADTDADTDSDTAVSPLYGSWTGRCDPASPDPYYQWADLVLDLDESGGDVTGTGTYSAPQTTYYGGTTGGGGTPSTTTTTIVLPVRLTGTWDGAEAVIRFGYDGPTGPLQPLPLELTASIAGTALVGTLTAWPNGTSGYVPIPFTCTLQGT